MVSKRFFTVVKQTVGSSLGGGDGDGDGDIAKRGYLVVVLAQIDWSILACEEGNAGKIGAVRRQVGVASARQG